MKAERYSERSV